MKKDITKMVHKGSTVLSFFFVGSGSVMLIVLSRVFHQETDKLHELNDIFQNPKARVVIGKDHGTQVIKKMKKIVHKKIQIDQFELEESFIDLVEQVRIANKESAEKLAEQTAKE